MGIRIGHTYTIRYFQIVTPIHPILNRGFNPEYSTVARYADSLANWDEHGETNNQPASVTAS